MGRADTPGGLVVTALPHIYCPGLLSMNHVERVFPTPSSTERREAILDRRSNHAVWRNAPSSRALGCEELAGRNQWDGMAPWRRVPAVWAVVVRVVCWPAPPRCCSAYVNEIIEQIPRPPGNSSHPYLRRGSREEWHYCSRRAERGFDPAAHT
jgi:hypothetical protein